MYKLTNGCFHQAVWPTSCPDTVTVLPDSLAKLPDIDVLVTDHIPVGGASARGARHQGMKS